MLVLVASISVRVADSTLNARGLALQELPDGKGEAATTMIGGRFYLVAAYERPVCPSMRVDISTQEAEAGHGARTCRARWHS